MPNLGGFGLKFENTIVIIEISAPEMVLFQSLVLKKNIWNWDQKYLIWVFLDWNLKTILSCLKSAPSNLSDCKISRKNENA